VPAHGFQQARQQVLLQAKKRATGVLLQVLLVLCSCCCTLLLAATTLHSTLCTNASPSINTVAAHGPYLSLPT
jgi:hypothetical protein